jgi:hypothetical protein
MKVSYFSIDNTHPNIFLAPLDNAHMTTSGRVRKYRQRMEEFFKSTCVASSNIESDEEFFGFQ